MKKASSAYSKLVVVPDNSAICGAIASPTTPIRALTTASTRSAKRRKESRVVIAEAVMAVMELPFDGVGGAGGPVRAARRNLLRRAAAHRFGGSHARRRTPRYCR